MQYDRIVQKAEQLGYNTSKIEGKEAKVQAIANAMGISNFNIDKDCNLLENALDDQIFEKRQNDRKEKFDKAKDTYEKYKKYHEDKSKVNDNSNVEPENKFNNHNINDRNLSNYQKPANNSINNLNSTGASPISNSNVNPGVNAAGSGAPVSGAATTGTTAGAVGATSGAASAAGGTVVGAGATAGTGVAAGAGATAGAAATGGAAAGGAAAAGTVGAAVATGGASLVVTAVVAGGAAAASKKAKENNDSAPNDDNKGKESSGLSNIFSKIGHVAALNITIPILIIIIVIVLMFAILFFLFSLLFKFNYYDANNNLNNLYTCDGMSMNETSLSRNDFIEKVRNYFANSSHPGAEIFIKNAGLIYDESTRNNINPELVVIRAYREGFSPSGNRNTLSGNPNLETYNNYWGLGCNNTGGLSNCTKYNSFDEGLLGFINNIKKYTSLTNMMSHYSSIGNYWYNTEDNSKNTGLGGCYYFEYMKDYMPSDRINAVSSACAPGNYCYKDGSGNCVETTDEDKLAYTKYQVSKMVNDRETIFGIPADECNSYSGQCTIFAQSDSRWGSISLGNSNSHMSDSGCAVTSLAIGISCSGTKITTEDFNPGVLVDAMNKGNCFTRGGAINSWNCPAINSIAPDISYVGMHNVKGTSNFVFTTLLNSFDSSKNFILVHYQNSDHPRGHFVVFLKIEGNKLVVQDPAGGGKITLVPMSDVLKIVIYEFKKDGAYEG